jgi:anti-sigma28 factor (negative regulator of flagellin synthesis)
MKVKLSKIVNSVPAFKILSQQANLSAKVSFKFAKALNIIQTELDLFEQTKNKIVSQYQVLNQQNELEIPQDKVEEIKKQLMDLLEEEVELNVEKVHINDLSGVTVTISNMMLMDYIFAD